MNDTNWVELWRNLVKTTFKPKTERLVERYEAHARKKTERPDPLLDFALKDINPQDTVIDIGPGTGRWTIPIAKIAKKVTAIEPTSGMVNLLKENVNKAGLVNVDIIQQTWEEAWIDKHDIIVGSHSMYGSPDFTAFIDKIQQCSQKRCYLAIRLPPANGIIGELSQEIYGTRYDSPDAIIAYNALYAMGIYANVIVEDGIVNWTNSTLDEAFIRAKRHLRLESNEKYDNLIRDTLDKRLARSQEVYIWPDGMRSALLWWTTNHKL